MKRLPIIALVVAVSVAVGTVVYYANETAMTTSGSCKDPNNVSSHIYNPVRFQTIKGCQTASGIVDSVIAEQDGDYHLWFHVDPQYANLPNSYNDAVHQGDLVAEIICATTVSQPDAVSACENYSNQIPIPIVGQNITVMGPYVLDNDHGWTEIHPVLSLVVS